MKMTDSYEEALLVYVDRLFACALSSLSGAEKERLKEKLSFFDLEEEITDRSRFLLNAREMYEKAVSELQKQGKFLTLPYLSETFSLNPYEEHVLSLLYAFELNPSYAVSASALAGGFGGGEVTPYLAAETFPGAIGRRELLHAFRREGKLVRYILEERPEGRQRMTSSIRLSDRVLSFLSGELPPEKCRLPFAACFSAQEPIAAWEGSRGWIDFLKKQLAEGTEPKAQGVVFLYGNEGSGRRLSVKTALKESGLDGLFLEFPFLFASCMDEGEEGFSRKMNAIRFELLLLRMVPVLVDISGDDAAWEEESGKKVFLERVLSKLYEVCPVIVVCADKKIPLSFAGNVYYLPEEKMSLSESLAYWEKQAEGVVSSDFNCDWMAGKFVLTRGQINQALAQAKRQAYIHEGGEEGLTMAEVTRECYEVIRHKMGKKAKRVETRYRMEDLILPKRQKDRLLRAIEQVRYRRTVYEEWGFQKTMSYGRGVSMAFVGAPGTGKTMAAQVIASELSMELYKVELSGIISKYIGETEKNLEEIFEQARKSQVILFFDEADALFSKRSEGKDTNDKYSNMEASFLLQKMEAYDGITILATNLFHHFDEAYKRRLKIVVDFPIPQEEDRRRLWHSMLPAELPCGEIDFDFLASRYELTGSNIRNILLHSAFLAAAKGKAMDMEEIIPALANEYGKNGKVFTKEDASEYYLFL